MQKKNKNTYLLVAFGICLYAALMRIEFFVGLVVRVWDIFFPVLLGFAIAFILNVPMAGLEKRFRKLTAKWKKKLSEGVTALVSLLLTIFAVLLVVALTLWLLLPSMIDSVASLYEQVMKNWPRVAKMLEEAGIDTTTFTKWLEGLDVQNLVGQITSGAGSIISSTVGAVSSVVTGISTFLISAIIACYVLLSKKQLSRQSNKLIRAYLKPKHGDYLLRAANLTRETFSKFLSGQCLEACLLGALIFLGLTIFGIPYAGLVGVLTAICAFIPYVGAFISFAIGAFLVLLVSPSQVLWFIIIYLVLQFIETQFIYPHVVGSSVGLSALWTLVAVLVGGNLMGVFGMIFFIPIAAVLSTLLSEYVNNTLKKKEAAKEDAPPASEEPQ